MDSLPEDQPKPKELARDTKRRIQRIKNGLVLQVALEDGSFWDEVREVRARWDIEALTQLPPEDRSLLYPERTLRVHRGEAKLTEQHIYDTHNWQPDIKRLASWLAVARLEQYQLDVDWRPFMAALVLFHPPLGRLQEFAEYGGIVRKDPYGEYGKTLRNDPEFRRKEETTSHDPMLVRPLISEFPNPYALERVQQDYYETLMAEINKRFLEPQGLDIDDMREEVLRDGTLDESLQERRRKIPIDLYVKISGPTTADERRKAVEVAALRLNKDKHAVEASNTDLMKVEIAYRRYRLRQDFRDMENRYPNISSETFKAYARDGRKILNKAG